MPADEARESADDARGQTMLRLQRMFTTGVAGHAGDADVIGVACPFCPPEDGASYTHIFNRINFLGNDNYDAAGRYALDVRGDVTAIEFWSETCAHRWALAFGFHKGATFVRVVRLTERPDDPDPDPDPETFE